MFSGLAAGTYTVEVQMDGYKPAEAVTVTVKPAETSYTRVSLESESYVPPTIVYENYPDPVEGAEGFHLFSQYNMGTATTAATHIAESVGSLFGSNKVKILERRNEDLQDRILELEEEARHREQQQAKHIQEITDAYEQRHRKLSEFVDYVKHYFPYVEKLMPTIKFLRDTLNFGDAIIRKLCTFKDVSIKGELYSCEFNQHFKADKTICSLKEDKEGKYNLHIDGVSHVSWFRRKKEEFMEKFIPQARRQNRCINL